MKALTATGFLRFALLASAVACGCSCSSDGGGGNAGVGGAGTASGGRGAGTGGQRGGEASGGNSQGGQPGGTGGTGGAGTVPGGSGGSGAGGSGPATDGPVTDSASAGAGGAGMPPAATCSYTPKANATTLKLKFEPIALTGVSTADISKDSGSKDGITEAKFVPGRPNELLLLQKRGKLNHLKLEGNQATLVKAYDIQVSSTQDCGLIAMAFDPDFANNKLIYVGFCTASNASKLVRYKWDADALSDPVDIMTWAGSGGPSYHSIGSMGFDRQGIMWILHGEFYTGANAQNLNNNLGKLLRLTPSRAPGQGGYTPAPDNPFAMDAKPRSAIYAWGLRSPWRGVLTDAGQWVVGDVQDQTNEELNVVTAKGQNFGWPGSSGACSGECTAPATFYRGSRDPYDGQGNAVKEARQGRAIWVGTQYGDCGNDRYAGALTGVILFGDFYAGWVRGLVLDGAGKPTKDVNMGELGTVSSMDQHADGHLYVTTLGPYGTAAGERAGLWRVVPQ